MWSVDVWSEGICQNNAIRGVHHVLELWLGKPVDELWIEVGSWKSILRELEFRNNWNQLKSIEINWCFGKKCLDFFEGHMFFLLRRQMMTVSWSRWGLGCSLVIFTLICVFFKTIVEMSKKRLWSNEAKKCSKNWQVPLLHIPANLYAVYSNRHIFPNESGRCRVGMARDMSSEW